MIILTSTAVARLTAYAEEATHSAYKAAEADIVANNVDPRHAEPRHVAHLCREIAGLASPWRSVLSAALPGTTLSMTSVFTHQTPLATWTNGNIPAPRCELADLLIAVIDRTSIVPVGRAALIQAKLSKHGDVTFGNPSEKNQWEIFSTRPVFDLAKPNGPQGVNLTGYSPDSAFMYGMATHCVTYFPPFCLHPYWRKTWVTADDLVKLQREHTIHPSDSLGRVLVGLLQGTFGWQFELLPAGQNWSYFSEAAHKDCWSELVNYLMTKTFAMDLKKLRLAAGRVSRGQDDVICFVSNASKAGPMALFLDGASSSRLVELVGAVDSDSGQWNEIDFDVGIKGGGGGGNVSDESIPDGEPPDGPISAIVFEIGHVG